MTSSFKPLRQTSIITETMAPTIKGRSLELETSQQANSALFDAILYPNRSLPNSGFVVLMTIVISVNIALGLFFTLMGAWPILIFGGLDILFVWLAFRISYRQGRLHERVRLTPSELSVSRVLPSGHEMRWSLPPYWTRLTFDDPIHHESQVQLHYKGKVLIIATFLSPEERLSFATTLQAAMEEARVSRAHLHFIES